MDRAARETTLELRIGLGTLATITSTAPWFGLLATVVAIPGSFVGCAGERPACVAATVERLSNSIWPTALGLAVGLIALRSYAYLSGRVEGFERERESASIELVNLLVRRRGNWMLGLVEFVKPKRVLREKSVLELARERRSTKRHLLVSVAAILIAWWIEVARYFGADSLPLYDAAWAALWHIVLLFALCCIPADALSSRLLRYRPGGMAGLASVFCFIWSVAEFFAAAF